MVAVYWIVYPRWRWLYALPPVAVASGLIALDYHFVGDVVAGAFVGALVGTYTAHFFRLSGHTDYWKPRSV